MLSIIIRDRDLQCLWSFWRFSPQCLLAKPDPPSAILEHFYLLQRCEVTRLKCKFHGYHEAASTLAKWNRRLVSPRLFRISYWEDDVSHPYVIAFPEQH